IVEAIVENAAAKRALFARLDALAGPATILASNTSSISITLLGAATRRPDRVLGMHFMNPAPVMPLVEMIRGQATSDDSMKISSVPAAAQHAGRRAARAENEPGVLPLPLTPPSTPQTKGQHDRSHDCDFPRRRFEVDRNGGGAEHVPPLGIWKQIPARDEPAVAEWPQRVDSEWRRWICAEPVQQQLRSVRSRAHRNQT